MRFSPPGIFGTIWGEILHLATESRQNALLWVLAIASENQLALPPVLESLADDERGWWRKQVLALSDQLKAGVPLPDALDRLPGLLPLDVVLATRVGWESGTLGGTLREAAVSATKRDETSATSFRNLFTYLFALLSILMSVAGFIMYYIIPKFKKIFSDFDTELPELTNFVIRFSDLVVNYFYLSLPLLGIVIWAILRYSTEQGTGIGARGSPLILLGHFFPRLKTAAILKHLSVVVAAGRPLNGAIATLANNHPDRAMRRRLAQVGKSFDRGDNHWQTLREAGLIRNSDAAVLEAAERAGNLRWALHNTAERIERRIDFRFNLITEFVRPILILGVGTAIGIFVISLFLPLIKLMNDLS